MRRPEALPSKPPGYPADLERHVRLADGTCVFVRPVVPDDADALAEAARSADPETLYYRFFTPAPRLDSSRIHYLTTLDYDKRMALAAFLEDGTGLAIARYEGEPASDEAEVAFTVREGFRRLGLASLLYWELETAAVERGIRRFTAVYLPENRAAAELLRHLGFGEPVFGDGLAEVRKDLPIRQLVA